MQLKTLRSTVKLVESISTRAATSLSTYLASVPYKKAINQNTFAEPLQATRLIFDRDGKKVAWSWGRGPLVIFLHGWEGCGSQFADIAMSLANEGFRAVALDATAHGDSSGHRSSYSDFLLDLVGLCDFLEDDVFAYVGHDDGGLCMMAARQQYGLTAERYVILASDQLPTLPLDKIQRRLQLSPTLLETTREKLARQLGCTWQSIADGSVFRYIDDSQLLIVHQNTLNNPTSLWPPLAKRITTDIHGEGILHDAEVRRCVTEFIAYI